MIGTNIKPIINPPEGPDTADNPELKPEKTGNPQNPIKRYNNTEDKLILNSNKSEITNMADNCMVILTVKGIAIHDEITITDVHIAIVAISFTHARFFMLIIKY